MAADQQREFVRVDDHIPLAWRLVSEADYAEMMTHFERNRQFPSKPENIAALLNTLDITDRLKNLERSDPHLAKILAKMDMKLNVLIQLFHPNNKEQPLVPRKVNLSGSGIAIWEETHNLKPGDVMEVRLALSNDALVSIECYTRVIRVFENNEDGMDKIACKFDPILTQDRERLIQHIFKRQAELIRTTRTQS
ncbi:MAG: PilZ domain-containing protein [Magnetococcales bacterium]|nr:PilZ domain-containing protein [Magnetococcales bacterium]